MDRKCIYCGKSEDLSISDIIPDALTNVRIQNKNVCRTEHNNKFSDMFESEVIKALSFITNELDIKSSKAKKYTAYNTTLTIDGLEYDAALHSERDIFDGRVLRSKDKTQIICSYEKALKISGDKSKIHPVDVNNLEIQKSVQINYGIFYSQSMYRMISKIAFEWYCSKNDVTDYHQEFDNIIKFITTGKGINPVSIIQQAELYTMLSNQLILGSHALFAFESSNGEIDVVISLFGLMIYRVIISEVRPKFCQQNFMFTELRTDSTRQEIKHESVASANKYFLDMLIKPKHGEMSIDISGLQTVFYRNCEANECENLLLYPFVFNMIKCFDGNRNDAKEPNETLSNIFFNQLKSITQTSTLHKKSIKRFVNERFPEGHLPIQLNPYASNKKDIVLFYAVFLVGLSDIDKLNESSFQRILKENLPLNNGEEMVVTDEVEQQLKLRIMKTANYPDILEKGASIIKQWEN